jgi:two-component system phosphate regulon response regulator PhoB
MDVLQRRTAQGCVLLATADDRLTSALEYILLTSNFRVLAANDSATLSAHLRAETPDALLFEPSLSGLDAIALCSAVRLEKRTRDVTILVLGSNNGNENGRTLLEKGADEYIARPFSPAELLTRIQAALKNERCEEPALNCLSFADLSLDSATYRVQRNGETIHLGLKEFRLLQHLMKNPHRVHSRDELQSAVWPSDAQIGLRTVDVHIGRLRGALRSAGGPDLIRTVRSVGYSLKS